jgi:hypothetical protein
VERDQRPAGGDERGGICASRTRQVLAQGHDRQEAEDADDDDGRFQDTSGDISKRDGFILPFDDGKQHHPDIGDDNDDFQEPAKQDAIVRTGTDDVRRCRSAQGRRNQTELGSRR